MSEQNVWKLLAREDPFWCRLLGKNTADDRSYFNMLVAQKSIQLNTRHGRFVSLITPIHITKLDYCMQYKPFVILGHAYFLNPYIQVARRLLASKR